MMKWILWFERHRVIVRCVPAHLLFCVLLCTSSLFAQTPLHVETGLQIERLRQKQSAKDLESLADQLRDQDKAMATYAFLSAQLLTARNARSLEQVRRVGDGLTLLSSHRQADHPCWPLWVMLDAEVRLYDQWAMRAMNPALFVRLGYPTKAQRDLVARWANPMRDHLALAMRKLELFPKEVRLLLQQRCGFLLANMAYLQSLTDPQSNPADLMQQALEALAPLLSQKVDAWQMKSKARWLQVQILLAMNQIQAASALSLPIADDVTSKLTVIDLRVAQRRFDAAGALLEQLSNEVASLEPVMRLLVADNLHRFWMGQGDPGQAFEMYLQLLADASKPLVRQSLVSRFAMARVRGSSLEALPSKVLYAIASELNAVALETSKPDPDQVSIAERCILLLKGRLPKINDGVFAQRVQLQWARSLVLKIQQPGDVIAALRPLKKLVSEGTDKALVYEALSQAYRLFDQFFKQSDVDLRVTLLSVYQPMASVLFERFGTSDLADNHRLFDVIMVRLPAGEYELALQRLADLPVSHPQYWLSLRYELGIYRQLMGKPDESVSRITTAVSRIRDLAMSQLAVSDSLKRNQIQQVVIESTGMLWQLAVKQAQWPQAAACLKWYESAQSVSAPVRYLWLSRRLVSLQRGGDWAAVEQLGQRFFTQWGQKGFIVVTQVLDEMDKQLQSQRKLVLGGKVAAVEGDLLKATLSLARGVVKWSSVHVDDEQQVLFLKLIWARSLCDAGQMRDALSLLCPLAEQFESNAALWLVMAECQFKLGMGANVQQAARIYRKLITRSIPNAQGQFPALYWHAWARYLQICDKTQQHTDMIFSRINSLQAEDSELGGEPYRGMLLLLKRQYARASSEK